MWITTSLLSFQGPLWLGVEAPDRVLPMIQIELNFSYVKLNCVPNS